MEAFEFLLAFFSDINVYIAGGVVYLFPKALRAIADKAWGAGKKAIKK